jgi:amino acid permease
LFVGDYRATHVPNPEKSISLYAISKFIFSLDCQANVVEVFSEMENKSIINLAFVAFSAAFGACMFYGAMGITGSLLFGDNMPQQDIIRIFADRESSIIQFLLSSNSKFYWVHYIVPCLAIIGILISSVYQLSAVTRSLYEKKILKKIINLDLRQKVVTSAVIMLVSVINMFQVDLDLVFDFISYFMSNFLGYLFPFIFIAYHYWKKNYYYVVPCVIIAIGSVCFGTYGFVNSVIEYAFSKQIFTQGKKLQMVFQRN